MDWAHEFVEGNTRASCSVCGVSRRFPDNLTYCVDKLFRCERCMEITPLERDRKIQSYRASAREEVDTGAGLLPRGEIPFTFLQTAQQRQAQLIPGWTPTTTFYDDFTIVPGGVGSSWSVRSLSGGTVTAPSVGVARLSSSGASSQQDAWLASMSAAATGRFYCACSFALTSVPSGTATDLVRIGACTLSVGVPTSTVVAAGVRYPGVSSSNYVLTYVGSKNAVSSIYLDASVYHLAEMWWKGDGRVWGAIDGELSISIVPAVATPWFPLLSSFTTVGGAIAFDVTDYVAMV